MTKKNLITLTIALLAVALVYWQLFRDDFQRPTIHISHTVRPRLSNPRRPQPTVSDAENQTTVNFSLGNEYKLTEIKVIPLAELATNKFAHPVWHLISDSNSAPLRAIIYGRPLRGMHPAVKGAQPDPIEDGKSYKIIIDAGKVHGEHDFEIGGQPAVEASQETNK